MMLLYLALSTEWQISNLLHGFLNWLIRLIAKYWIHPYFWEFVSPAGFQGPRNVSLCSLGQPHSVRMWTVIRMYLLTAFTHSLQTRPEWHQSLFQNAHSRIHSLLLFKISLWFLLPIGKKVKKIPNLYWFSSISLNGGFGISLLLLRYFTSEKDPSN